MRQEFEVDDLKSFFDFKILWLLGQNIGATGESGEEELAVGFRIEGSAQNKLILIRFGMKYQRISK